MVTITQGVVMYKNMFKFSPKFSPENWYYYMKVIYIDKTNTHER